MNTDEKYAIQRDDAANRLGINIQKTKPEVAILIENFSGEGLTLAKAIKDIAPQFTIVGHEIGSNISQILQSDGILSQSGASTIPTYCIQQYNSEKTRFHGNYGNFKGVSGNKRLTSMILRNAGIYTPRELTLHLSDFFPRDMGDLREMEFLSMEEQRIIARKRARNVKDFCKSLGNNARIVIKPVDGQCGKNVFIGSYTHIDEDLMFRDEYSVESDLVVQEKIDSYPLYDNNGTKLDWNVRVLTTVDKNGNVIVSGITGKIDKDGGPVNRSISADNISLKDIAQRIGWSEQSYNEVKKGIEETAIKSVTALIKKITPKHPLETQDLAGVDIIVDGNLNPCVIEVNDSDSGCIYELMCLEGIESIYPIAEAIVRKAKVGFTIIELYEIFYDEFGDFTEKLINYVLRKDINVEDFEGGISLVGVTKIGSDFLEYTNLLKQIQETEVEQ